MESPRFEMVVLELAKRGLVSSNIEEIEYGEYTMSKAGDVHISKWKQKLNYFGRPHPEPAESTRCINARQKFAILSGLAIVLLILIILASNLQCPRRF